jgi:hypothetical protein
MKYNFYKSLINAFVCKMLIKIWGISEQSKRLCVTTCFTYNDATHGALYMCIYTISISIYMDLFEEDDDYETIKYLNYWRRLYSVHGINHMLAWDDHDFRMRFRFGKDVRNLLVNTLFSDTWHICRAFFNKSYFS